MKRIQLILFLFIVLNASAQNDHKVLQLDQVIEIARNQSLDALSAKQRFRASYWSFRSYQASLRPSLTFSAEPINLKRSISIVTNSDGTESFVHQNVMNSSAGISVNQNVGLTGGSIFLNSDLQRITLMGDSLIASYLASPVSIGFRQPLFAFNSLKWDKKVAPLQYEEAKRQYIMSMEDVSSKAVELFFNLVLAQINEKISVINYSNNDTLYKIAHGRYNIGTIPKNELLQMELAFLNSRNEMAQAGIDLQTAKFAIRSFLGYDESVDIELVVPYDIPAFSIEVDKAISEAKENNPDMIRIERNMIEARRDVARAKAENRFNADFYAAYGLTQSSFDVQSAYRNPEDRQTATVGITVPLIDWGLGKGKYLMAKSNEELVKISSQQQLTDFEQNIYLNVMRFNMQDEQVLNSAKADTIAMLRYEVAMQRYYIGKIDILNLNVALTEKDNAKRSFLGALRSYWSSYYYLRRLTLYDFEKNQPIEVDYDHLLN